MLPLAFAMWQSDATVRGAFEQSVQANLTSVDEAALVAGTELAVDARTLGIAAAYGARLRGRYGLLIPISFARGATTPTNTGSIELGGDAGYQVTPHTYVSLDTVGFLASRLGVRAVDALAARDPFLFGNRVEYVVGGGLGIATRVTQRASFQVSGGYAQAGALDADVPAAVGVDAHTGRAAVAYSYDVGRDDTLTPTLRYVFTHYYHALYDVDLRRGPADIHAGTATVGESHEFTRRFRGTVNGGLTIASPPPILDSSAAIVSPEARVAVSYLSRRHTMTASYDYTYESLGPRIGFGAAHAATFELTLRPVDGARWRDLVVHGLARIAHGSAPVAANPPLNTGPLPSNVPKDGTITTTTAVASATFELPIFRGLALLGGMDLALVRASFDPQPVDLVQSTQVQIVVTGGLAYTVSTDPARTVTRDPADDDAAARVRTRGEPSGGQRLEDRTVETRDEEP